MQSKKKRGLPATDKNGNHLTIPSNCSIRVPLLTPQNQLPPEPKTIAIRLWKIDTTLSGKTQFKLFWADGRIHMAEGESMRLWIRLLSAECCASWWWHCDGIMCILMELKRIISETRDSLERGDINKSFAKHLSFFFSRGIFLFKQNNTFSHHAWVIQSWFQKYSADFMWHFLSDILYAILHSHHYSN